SQFPRQAVSLLSTPCLFPLGSPEVGYFARFVAHLLSWQTVAEAPQYPAGSRQLRAAAHSSPAGWKRSAGARRQNRPLGQRVPPQTFAAFQVDLLSSPRLSEGDA